MSLSGSVVFVPTIVYGIRKYEYNATVVGVYFLEEEAVKNLIAKLVQLTFLDSKKHETELGLLSQDEFIHYLQNKVHSRNDLDNICCQYQDLYYKDLWKFQINEFVLSL